MTSRPRTDLPQRTDLGKVPAPGTHRKAFYGEQAGHCRGCVEHFNVQNLTVDRIIAKAVGGTDHPDNLQLLCGRCNSVKGDGGQECLQLKLARVRSRRWAAAS